MRKVLESFEKRRVLPGPSCSCSAAPIPNAIALLRQFAIHPGLVQPTWPSFDPEGAADDAALIWAVLSNLLTATMFYRCLPWPTPTGSTNRVHRDAAASLRTPAPAGG